MESQVVECVVEQGSVGVGEMAVAHWQEAYYRALVVKEEKDNLLLHFVDWGNTDWVSKSLVWPEPPADLEFLSLLRISEFFRFYIAEFWQTF